MFCLLHDVALGEEGTSDLCLTKEGVSLENGVVQHLLDLAPGRIKSFRLCLEVSLNVTSVRFGPQCHHVVLDLPRYDLRDEADHSLLQTRFVLASPQQL